MYVITKFSYIINTAQYFTKLKKIGKKPFNKVGNLKIKTKIYNFFLSYKQYTWIKIF